MLPCFKKQLKSQLWENQIGLPNELKDVYYEATQVNKYP